MTEQELKQRTKGFSLRVLKLVDSLIVIHKSKIR
jgi:hypothetical protein